MSSKKPRSAEDAPFAYEGLDRLIHEHARLSVLTALIANGAGLAFNDLKRMCNLTDGNLSRHLQVLDDAGLITIFKGVEGNRSLTLCRITSEGRKKYMEYLAVLEQVVTDAAGAIQVDGQRREAEKTLRS
ncbi:MAG: transcriptional regulator [Proteobacteria bacterium]|nr:transcriptional regulator [Pseudomonadota bacterium]